MLIDNDKDCLGDLSRQETSTESLITFTEAGEGSVTCKIKLGIDTLPFKIELFGYCRGPGQGGSNLF